MKTILQLILLLLFVLVIWGTVRFTSRASAAQNGPEELFEPAASTQPLLGTDDTGVTRFRPVRFKSAALQRAGAALATSGLTRAALLLNLFDDVRQEAWLERVERRAGAEVYIGRLKDIPGSFVHLAISQGNLAGSVTWPGSFYAVRYAGNGLHLIQQINQNAMLRDAEPLPAQPDPVPAVPAADDGSLIDVMVVYTTAARTGAGGEAAIQSLINLGISETNTAYANSQVIQRLRLVHTAEVSYTETGNSSTDLSRLRSTSDGFMDNVHALRDTYGADLVTLIINTSSDGACGVGYLMNGVNPGFASSAFNVVRRSCVSPNYSFGHELGHNQGLNHAREDPIGSGAFTYSFGFKNPNSLFRTVMAYNCTPGCPRVLHFSNPEVNYLEQPTGVVTSQSNSAHNAQSLNNTRVTVANFRASVGGTGLQFYPLATPVRLLDTRAGQSACFTPNAPIAGGTSRIQPARGQCGGLTIPVDAAAITGNITTVNSGGGYLTLYPSDAQQPTVANSNYAANEILNNVFTVGLGTNDGAFKIFVTSNTDVVVDVTGYYAPPGAANPGGLYFHSLPQPRRLLDTRAGFAGCFVPGAPLPANVETPQLARLSCNGIIIPAAALAIVGNATTVNPTGGGYLTFFPADATRPLVASSNFLPGQTMNAPFTVGLSAAGLFKIFTTTQTDLVVDVLGYYSAEATDINGPGLLFYPAPKPVRLLETRAGFTGCSAPGAPLLGGSTRTQTARGVCDGVTIAANARAIVGNATVVNPSGGFLTFWPSDAAQPTVATSNFAAGQIFNRHFIVGLGAIDGAFKIFTQFQTDLVIDVSGFFAP